MGKWFFGATFFAGLALYTNSNAWYLPATFCAVTAFVWGFRNGR